MSTPIAVVEGTLLPDGMLELQGEHKPPGGAKPDLGSEGR